MEEKNCWERFSKIILSALFFLLLHSSSDSLQGVFFETGADDCKTRNAQVTARIVKNNDMVYFSFIVGWLFPFDAGCRVNVTAKINREPGKKREF